MNRKWVRQAALAEVERRRIVDDAIASVGWKVIEEVIDITIDKALDGEKGWQIRMTR